MRLLTFILLASSAALAHASSWDCRNDDLEIRCSAGKCRAAHDFTPFSINVDTHGAVSICAYSGCWEGRGKVLKSGTHILLSGTRLKWTGANPGTADFIVAIDTSDKVGFVQGEGFAMPTTCRQRTR